MQFNQRSSMTKLTVGALLTAAVGVFLQYLSGVGDFPTIPPGPVVLTVLAAIVAFMPWRWTPILGTLMGISLIFGFFQNESVGRFSDLTPLLGFLGLWIQVVGVIVAIVAGVLATVRNYQDQSTSR